MGKVSKFTHFPLEPRCEEYYFLGQVVADFEFGLYSILTDSLETPELDAFFDKPDTMTSSVTYGFLCLVSTISDNSKPQLAPSIKCHKLCFEARVLVLPYHTTGRQNVYLN